MHSTPDSPTSASAVTEPSGTPVFSSLFVFWKPRELAILLPAILASVVVAGAKVAFAVVLGMIFQETANIGSGDITADEGLSRIAILCLALTGTGLLKALSSACFMALWILHGESRARTIWSRLFRSLLHNSMAWFDSR